MSSRFVGYGPWAGEIIPRTRGSLVSTDTGEATSHAIENLQVRATMFVSPMDKVYAGMIVGENSRAEDMPCNPCKKKHLTNMRSATKELNVGLKVPRKPTLESALEWIAEDELVEITPVSIRIRKMILSAEERKKAERRSQAISAAG
jgi:GTP-binding protein